MATAAKENKLITAKELAERAGISPQVPRKMLRKEFNRAGKTLVEGNRPEYRFDLSDTVTKSIISLCSVVQIHSLPPFFAFFLYVNSSLDRAISTTAGIPRIIKDNAAAIEPARDHRHRFLITASIPPTMASMAITMAGIDIPKMILGTNGGISPLPKPLPAAPKPIA